MIIPRFIFRWTAALVALAIYLTFLRTFASEPPSSSTSSPPLTSASLRPSTDSKDEVKGMQSIEVDHFAANQKLWNFSAYGEQYFSASQDRDYSITGLNIEAERRFDGKWSKYFSLAASAGIHYAYGTSQYLFEPEPIETETTGFSLAVIGRVYVWELDRFSFYLEGSPGVIASTVAFPRNGSNVNFLARYGAGMKIAVDDSIDVIVGYRRLFIGNGGGKSPDNPTYEGNGFILGAGVKF